eukprot:13325.XXX_163018_163158_1 [CDS] Oithona nana genome sequencing.
MCLLNDLRVQKTNGHSEHLVLVSCLAALTCFLKWYPDENEVGHSEH